MSRPTLAEILDVPDEQTIRRILALLGGVANATP